MSDFCGHFSTKKGKWKLDESLRKPYKSRFDKYVLTVSKLNFNLSFELLNLRRVKIQKNVGFWQF